MINHGNYKSVLCLIKTTLKFKSAEVKLWHLCDCSTVSSCKKLGGMSYLAYARILSETFVKNHEFTTHTTSPHIT